MIILRNGNRIIRVQSNNFFFNFSRIMLKHFLRNNSLFLFKLECPWLNLKRIGIVENYSLKVCVHHIHHQHVLSIDPTDIKRSLCQTMQVVRSINYFRDTLTTALNYFGRKQKKIKQISKEENGEDFIEIIQEDEDEIPIIEPKDSLHDSYRLFYQSLPLGRDVNPRQTRIRDIYKKICNIKSNEPLMKLDQISENFFEEDDDQDSSHLLERIISDEEFQSPSAM